MRKGTFTKSNLKINVEVSKSLFSFQTIQRFPGEGLKGLNPINTTNKYVKFNTDLHFYRKQIVAYTQVYFLVQKYTNNTGEFSAQNKKLE
jgi:hypothetical protein